jgi:hypothetical protein
MLFYEKPASYSVYRHERCPLKKIEEVSQGDPNTWPEFIENAKVGE